MQEARELQQQRHIPVSTSQPLATLIYDESRQQQVNHETARDQTHQQDENVEAEEESLGLQSGVSVLTLRTRLRAVHLFVSRSALR